MIAALGSEGADLYLAAVELGRRHLSRSRPPRERLVRAGAAAGVLRPMLAGAPGISRRVEGHDDPCRSARLHIAFDGPNRLAN